MKAITATRITAGTKMAATESASAWIGARERCASATMATTCDSVVSAPVRSTRISKLPVPFRVPPVTVSPATFSTGTGSPVSIDSSTALLPSMTVPSIGTLSPGRTRSTSPTFTDASGTVSVLPPGPTRRAVFGARSRRARMAPPVRSRARSSSTCPSSTSATITAAAS